MHPQLLGITGKGYYDDLLIDLAGHSGMPYKILDGNDDIRMMLDQYPNHTFFTINYWLTRQIWKDMRQMVVTWMVDDPVELEISTFRDRDIYIYKDPRWVEPQLTYTKIGIDIGDIVWLLNENGKPPKYLEEI